MIIPFDPEPKRSRYIAYVLGVICGAIYLVMLVATFVDESPEPASLRNQMAHVTAPPAAIASDYEAMLKTGVNPITKEKLTLDNAPASMMVDTHGNPVPLDQQALYKATSQEKQTADTARQLLQISNELRLEVRKNPILIGPLMGADLRALRAIGCNSHHSRKLLDDVSFLQSAAARMHSGRFSDQILENWSEILNAHMDQSAFAAALDSIDEIASRYAKEDRLITVGEQKQLNGSSGVGRRMIFVRDPQGKLHQTLAGTQLPQGWTLESRN